MALAFAPAAFRLDQLRINNPAVVSKSYPKFWEDLKAAGFMVKSE
jgi:3-phosphoshikimate 1-carboxyvinyltransferase